MTDDREALVSENHRLREANRSLRLFAMGLLVLVFMLIVPFTATVYEIMKDLSLRAQGFRLHP
jgi:hypothetical protein